MQKILKVITYIFSIIILFIAIFFVFYVFQKAFAKINKTEPFLNIYTIVSPSMEPKIKIYDMVIVKKVKNDNNLKIGDIISFYSDTINTNGYTITHRIFKSYENNNKIYYVTKGDNNLNADDGVITLDNVVGKVIFIIPNLGKLQNFISSKIGWLIIILIPSLLIIFFDVYKIIKILSIRSKINKVKYNNNVDKEYDKKVVAAVEEAKKINNK